MKVAQLLGCRAPGGAKCAGTQTASPAGVRAQQGLFEPLVAGDQKASLASLSLQLHPHAPRVFPSLGSFSVVWHFRHIQGPPCLGSYSVDRCIMHLKGHLGGVLLCSSVPQASDGPVSLLLSC